MTVFLIVLGVVELYYWGVYVPRAWRKPGTNRGIDDIRYFVRYLREKRKP